LNQLKFDHTSSEDFFKNNIRWCRSEN